MFCLLSAARLEHSWDLQGAPNSASNRRPPVGFAGAPPAVWTRPATPEIHRACISPSTQNSAARPGRYWPSMAPCRCGSPIQNTASKAAQRLRYHIFYQEMSAIPNRRMRLQKRDFDKYDRFCDHMLVVDRDSRDEFGEPAVVGTYRLLRGEVAARHGGYYTSSEYDLSSVMANNGRGTRYLELGRSCVLKSYRGKPITMQLLWKGIMVYLERYRTDVMFGCGSLPGTDPEALKLPLSYLHHFHRAPESQHLRARPELVCFHEPHAARCDRPESGDAKTATADQGLYPRGRRDWRRGSDRPAIRHDRCADLFSGVADAARNYRSRLTNGDRE